MQGYTPATLHCRSPGCDQKWHIQSFWLGFSSYRDSWCRILQQYNHSYLLLLLTCAKNQQYFNTWFCDWNNKVSLEFFISVCWARTRSQFCSDEVWLHGFPIFFRVLGLVTICTVRLVTTNFEKLFNCYAL